MSELKKIFFCSNCEAQFPKWSGRCLECGDWGTIKEGAAGIAAENAPTVKFDSAKLIDLQKISGDSFSRIKLNMPEIDNVFGGGLVRGSITLLAGEPGIGKSTVVLQILRQMESAGQPLLYVSGEESAEQIKLRMQRLNYEPKNLKFLPETNAEQICAAIKQLKPQLAIIDSIQTIHSNEAEGGAGNVSQIRASAAKLLEAAKTTGSSIIVTGHITKDGAAAGPKTLEHLVDVVIYLEGDEFHGYRILRSTKNRFGSTNEIGVLVMTAEGLSEVKDTTRAFLTTGDQNISGSVISCFMEGSRAFLAEVQALVTPTIFGYPQRKTSGYDLNRLQMISAVLFKRAQINLNNQDIHLNIVGGIKILEPAIDLAAGLAIISALKNITVPKDAIVIGEIGLGGEIRPVANIEKRLSEAEKLGFKTAIVPNMKLSRKFSLTIRAVSNINEAGRMIGA